MNCTFSECEKGNPASLYRIDIKNKAVAMLVPGVLVCAHCYEKLRHNTNMEVTVRESRKSEESLWIPKLDLKL
jgi:hypothetical protein